MRISDWSSDVCSSDLLPIFQARRYRCVRAGHPEAAKLSLNLLAKYPFVCPGGEKGISHAIRQIFSDLDIEFPSHRVITSNSLSAAKEVVLNSDGFAILSDLSFFHEKKSGLIVSAEIDQVVEPYWFHMVLRSDYFGSAMLIKFITALHLVCEEWDVPLHAALDRIRPGRPLPRIN